MATGITINILDQQIQDRLFWYLINEISLKKFRDWFIPITWNVHKYNDSIIEDFTYEIELWIAEFLNGDWTEQELKDHLRPLIYNGTV